MMDSFITKPPAGFVVIFATHMMINVQSQAGVTGILGSNITLKFTFTLPVRIQNNSYIMVHKTVNKVAEYRQGSKGEGFFDLHPENNSVIWHITSARLADCGNYSASVLVAGIAYKSNTVQVEIQGVDTNSTATPGPTDNPVTGGSGGWNLEIRNAKIVAISVITLIVLMAGILAHLLWSLYGVKGSRADKQEPQDGQSSPPTVQETVSSASASAPSVVYMVLEFPKRASAVSDTNPNCTEYAKVSYAQKI